MGDRTAALGFARARAPETTMEPNDVDEACEPARSAAWQSTGGPIWASRRR
jgi:hypothetical protein